MLSVEGVEKPLDWPPEMVRASDLARLSVIALIEAFRAAMAAAHQQVPAHDTRGWSDDRGDKRVLLLPQPDTSARPKLDLEARW